MMVWQKCTNGEYGEYVLAWVTDAVICPDLPPCTAVIGVHAKGEDGVHRLHSFLLPQDDDYDDENLHHVVEGNAALEYDADPEWLGRMARSIMNEWLNLLPEWFVNWYRDSIREE